MTPKSEILDNLIATIVENTTGDVTATDILTVFQQIIDSYLHQEDSINHNDLANLNLDDYKHLTAVQLSALETIISTYADKIDTVDAQSLADTAETNAKSYADTVSGTAETNAKSYADTVSGTAETNAKSYADTLVVGLLDDRGNYDASSNLFPSSGGSGDLGAIKKGDLWSISVGGTLAGISVTVGDVIRALSDTPGQTSTNWSITENNLGFVPEPAIPSGTTSQFLRGDKTWQTISLANIYNSDGTLSGARTVTMAGNQLSFIGANNRLAILGNGIGTSFLQVTNGSSGTTSGDGMLIGYDTDGEAYIKCQDSNQLILANSGGNALLCTATKVSIPNNIIVGAPVSSLGTGAQFQVISSGTTSATIPIFVTNLASSKFHIFNGAGNVSLGASSTTIGARLQVNGAGTTSATSSLLVQNSAGTKALECFDSIKTIVYQSGSVNSFIVQNVSNTEAQSLRFRNDAGDQRSYITSYVNVTLQSEYSVVNIKGGNSGGSYNESVDLYGGTTNLAFRVDSSGRSIFTSATNWYNIISAQANDKIVVDGFNSAWKNSSSVPSNNIVDHCRLYASDQVAGNSCLHTRTENGAIIKLYQETTAVTSGTLVSNSGTTLTSTDTIDGYTLQQVVKALRNLGILA